MDDFLVGPQCDEFYDPYDPYGEDPIEDQYLDSFWESRYDVDF